MATGSTLLAVLLLIVILFVISGILSGIVTSQIYNNTVFTVNVNNAYLFTWIAAILSWLSVVVIVVIIFALLNSEGLLSSDAELTEENLASLVSSHGVGIVFFYLLLLGAIITIAIIIFAIVSLMDIVNDTLLYGLLIAIAIINTIALLLFIFALYSCSSLINTKTQQITRIASLD